MTCFNILPATRVYVGSSPPAPPGQLEGAPVGCVFVCIVRKILSVGARGYSEYEPLVSYQKKDDAMTCD